ncbi:hypothetical protein CAL12_05520 [Bordetella genomosp. 8]|uniref:Uncharacterized protein n=1 Tax=Bordetella genomosp. 8 TaxID=1416806 RepID=A0A1W6YH64_9BORD|nr:hypothetical protein [Bordetella genomosp. 8]ARP80344.1 hypothetical protein CAL12_05520 [Bordetella genomosp. 8]
MSNRDTPHRPTGLSGQEEEALRTLEKGYDPDAGALPDKELPVHDDRDRKPGDDAMAPQGRGGKGRQAAGPDAHVTGRQSSREAGGASADPLGDAERKGLLPSSNVATPPMDRPDDTGSMPANLDPDTTRRRP